MITEGKPMRARHPAVEELASILGHEAAELDAETLARSDQRLRELLHRAGEAAVPALRTLLQGPTLPVLETKAGGTYGAKIVAAELLGEYGRDEDEDALAAVATESDEPDAVRTAAAEAWIKLRGDQAAPALVEFLLHLFAHAPREANLLMHALEPHWPLMVRPLLGHLYHRDMSHRLRAKALLVALGPHAIDGLSDIVRTSEDHFARSDAAEALSRIDITALHDAVAARDAEHDRIEQRPRRKFEPSELDH